MIRFTFLIPRNCFIRSRLSLVLLARHVQLMRQPDHLLLDERPVQGLLQPNILFRPKCFEEFRKTFKVEDIKYKSGALVPPALHKSINWSDLTKGQFMSEWLHAFILFTHERADRFRSIFHFFLDRKFLFNFEEFPLSNIYNRKDEGTLEGTRQICSR